MIFNILYHIMLYYITLYYIILYYIIYIVYVIFIICVFLCYMIYDKYIYTHMYNTFVGCGIKSEVPPSHWVSPALTLRCRMVLSRKSDWMVPALLPAMTFLDLLMTCSKVFWYEILGKPNPQKNWNHLKQSVWRMAKFHPASHRPGCHWWRCPDVRWIQTSVSHLREGQTRSQKVHENH